MNRRKSKWFSPKKRIKRIGFGLQILFFSFFLHHKTVYASLYLFFFSPNLFVFIWSWSIEWWNDGGMCFLVHECKCWWTLFRTVFIKMFIFKAHPSLMCNSKSQLMFVGLDEMTKKNSSNRIPSEWDRKKSTQISQRCNHHWEHIRYTVCVYHSSCVFLLD